MNRVNTQKFETETFLLKRENRLLWVLLILVTGLSLYKDWKVEQVKARITPQSVIDACFFVNKGAK